MTWLNQCAWKRLIERTSNNDAKTQAANERTMKRRLNRTTLQQCAILQYMHRLALGVRKGAANISVQRTKMKTTRYAATANAKVMRIPRGIPLQAGPRGPKRQACCLQRVRLQLPVNFERFASKSPTNRLHELSEAAACFPYFFPSTNHPKF